MREDNLFLHDQCDQTSQRRGLNGASGRTRAYIHFIKTLHASRSRWSVPAAEFYVAQLLTGIQPYEWRTAQRCEFDHKPGLWFYRLQNIDAISTYRRKTVMLDAYDTALVELIDRHIDRVQRCETDEAFQSFYCACKRIVEAVALRSVPAAYKWPSLDGKTIALSKVHREAIACAACTLQQGCPL